MRGRVVQVNVSPGGVPKRAVAEAVVGPLGLAGDGVNHPKIHGGPERAVCLWSLERILALQQEGHRVFPGAAGENLTVTGLDWADLAIGDTIDVGDSGLRLELTSPTGPCRTIAPFFEGGAFRRVDDRRYPGWSRWYARVVHAGEVRPGDVVVVRRGGSEVENRGMRFED